MSAARVVEAFDEREDDESRLGVRLEPATAENFASSVAKKRSATALQCGQSSAPIDIGGGSACLG